MKKTLLFFALLLTPILVGAHEGFATYTDGHMFSWGEGMMGGGLWSGFMFLGVLVWLVVGILAIVWLWEQVNKNK